MTTAWTPAQVRTIDPATAPRVPVIAGAERSDLLPGLVYWDMWPIQDATGHIARLGERELWMALSAPDRGDPALRHFEAKIRLLERTGPLGAERWTDLGPVLPDGPVPYEREWAGSASTDGTRVSLWFTGAGTSERPGGYQQALYEAHAIIGPDGLPRDWSAPQLSLASGPAYQSADAHDGEPGRIKAFRDPAWLCDPADGAEYLVFTASVAGASSPFNGAVGLARRTADGWEALPPLVTADGVNNELERAHVLVHQGRYLVFWVTQTSTFSPQLRSAPSGLYGMIADSLAGPWRPLNGSGLVLANPVDEPLQSYSWFVSADLVVSSFVDIWGLRGGPCPVDTAALARHFGGVPAPLLQLVVEGDCCRIAERTTA